MKTIVVGVDGSECGNAALEFAVEEAALRGASLRVVCAWEPSSWAYIGTVAVPYDVYSRYREHAEAVVGKAVARVTELEPAIACEGRVVMGQPGQVLLEESRDAALLVVGSRGHGRVASPLLGSAGQRVVHHAPCPVVVVHGIVC